MNALARSLAVVAALSAAPALAHPDHPLPAPPPPPIQVVPVQAPQPHAGPAYAAPPAAAPLLRPVEWAPRYGGKIRALQAEYRSLERARARFYAGWHGNPGAQRRFERWYAWRRAELDRRYAWLVEQREHRGHGRYAWNEHERHGD